MKKTLLIAAAALAAGIISSQAQAVYSQNVVGYINQVVPAGKFNLLANQLNFVGPNGTNAVNDVLVNGNFVSGGTGGSPNPAESILYYWNGTSYNFYYYYSSNDLQVLNGGTPYGPSGWYDASFTLTTSNLNQGAACFVYNPSGTAITNTFVGSVVQGIVTNGVVHGFNLVSCIPPLGLQSLDSTNYNFPSYGDDGSETAYLWNGTSYNFVYWWSGAYLATLDPNYVADGYKPGWYDAGGTDHSYNAVANDPIWASVGEGTFVFYTGPATNWVSTFNVQ